MFEMYILDKNVLSKYPHTHHTFTQMLAFLHHNTFTLIYIFYSNYKYI